MARLSRTTRILVTLALAGTAVLAVALPALGATAVSISSRAGWVATGVEVTAGEVLTVRTLGSVHTAPIPDFHIPGEFKSASGPAGQTSGSLCGDVTAGFPPELLEQTGPCAHDDAYFGELIGRIGGVTFVIGETSSIVAPASGELELAANDLTLTYWDNAGSFTVLVR